MLEENKECLEADLHEMRKFSVCCGFFLLEGFSRLFASSRASFIHDHIVLTREHIGAISMLEELGQDFLAKGGGGLKNQKDLWIRLK